MFSVAFFSDLIVGSELAVGYVMKICLACTQFFINKFGLIFECFITINHNTFHRIIYLVCTSTRNTMYENSHAWRRKLRIQLMVDIAKKELDSGKEFEEIYAKLEQEMLKRWKLVSGTRKQYLDTIRKVLDNQFVLTH